MNHFRLEERSDSEFDELADDDDPSDSELHRHHRFQQPSYGQIGDSPASGWCKAAQ